MSLAGRLRGEELLVAAGAHDALSAVLVEQAGLDGVWLSSLGVATALRAIPDEGLITMSEMATTARHVAARVRVPVIVDCESGYGGGANAAHAVRELERAGVAAVALDDNALPKRNSLFRSAERSLAPTAELVAKVRAAIAARRSPELLVLARTEALVAGLGVEEALERARAYAEAGADALIVQALAWEPVADFCARWDGTLPLVAIPTLYPEVAPGELRSAGIRLAIYANQGLRAAIAAIETAWRAVRAGEAATLGARIAPLERITEIVARD